MTFTRAMLAATLAASIAFPAFAQTNDPARRDEYGLKPDDGSDRDLLLPDPVLDRNWPALKRGEDPTPARIAPDEDEVDPFREEEAEPEPPPPPAPPVPASPPAVVPKRPERPVIAPDGRLDPGTPIPAPDPAIDDPLEPEVEPEDLSDVEKEERAPSAFDRGEGLYEDDMHRDDFHEAPIDDAGE